MINKHDSISQRHASDAGDSKTRSENIPQKSNSKEKYYPDDLIVTLANAYENRRARQVSEWERSQSVRHAYL